MCAKPSQSWNIPSRMTLSSGTHETGLSFLDTVLMSSTAACSKSSHLVAKYSQMAYEDSFMCFSNRCRSSWPTVAVIIR
eukprot:6372790-Prymnesium_polylepis.1